jgi:dihydroorotase-like cyclic amidohydrolase
VTAKVNVSQYDGLAARPLSLFLKIPSSDSRAMIVFPCKGCHTLIGDVSVHVHVGFRNLSIASGVKTTTVAAEASRLASNGGTFVIRA